MGRILISEINRVHEIMGTSKLINEGFWTDFLENLVHNDSDDLIKGALRRDISQAEKAELESAISKMKSGYHIAQDEFDRLEYILAHGVEYSKIAKNILSRDTIGQGFHDLLERGRHAIEIGKSSSDDVMEKINQVINQHPYISQDKKLIQELEYQIREEMESVERIRTQKITNKENQSIATQKFRDFKKLRNNISETTPQEILEKPGARKNLASLLSKVEKFSKTEAKFLDNISKEQIENIKNELDALNPSIARRAITWAGKIPGVKSPWLWVILACLIAKTELGGKIKLLVSTTWKGLLDLFGWGAETVVNPNKEKSETTPNQTTTTNDEQLVKDFATKEGYDIKSTSHNNDGSWTITDNDGSTATYKVSNGKVVYQGK